MKRTSRRYKRNRKTALARRFSLNVPVIILLTAVLSVALILVFGWHSRLRTKSAHDAVPAQIPVTEPLSSTKPPAPAAPVSLKPVPEGGQASVYVSESERYSIAREIELQSPYVYLIHVPTGGVLLDRGSTERIYPASMTKVMTALVVMDRLESWDEPVTVNPEMFPLIAREELSSAGFAPGEIVTAKDLLYGLLFRSGAECAIALAEHISGSEASFAELMNAKAASLGMTGTHFTNTVGYHSEDHYSTLRDMAVMFRTAMSNPWYYQISSARTHTSTPTPEHPEGLTIQNSLFRYVESAPDSEVRILAGKTGTTSQAGRCLVSEALVYGQLFLCVTTGAQGGTQPHMADALAVYSAIARDPPTPVVG